MNSSSLIHCLHHRQKPCLGLRGGYRRRRQPLPNSLLLRGAALLPRSTWLFSPGEPPHTKCPPASRPAANYGGVKDTEGSREQGCLPTVLLLPMTTLQSRGCCQVIKMAYKSSLTTCSTWDPSESKQNGGRFPEGYLPLSGEVCHKENSEAKTSLTLGNGWKHHFAEI